MSDASPSPRADRAAISRRRLIASGAAAAFLASAGRGAAATVGGLLRLAVSREAAARVIAPGTVFDCLTVIAPDGTLRGEAASDWTADTSGSVWRFVLREGLRWHDGTAVTAGQVAAILLRHRAVGGALSDASRIDARDPRTLHIHLDAADPGFPFRLALPQLALRDPSRPGIGTGAFRIDGDVGARTRLVRIARDGGTMPGFDTVELLMEDDPRRRLETALIGRVDAAGMVDAPPADNRRLRFVAIPGSRHLRLRATGSGARAVASAIKTGLDRDALVADALATFGRAAGDAPIPLGSEVPRADTDRARHILRRAGIDHLGLALGPGCTGLPRLPDVVSAMAAFGRMTGMAVSAVDRARAGLVLEVAAAQPTEDLALCAFPRDGLSDLDAFERGIRAARGERNSAKAAAIRQELAQRLAAEALTAVPAFIDSTFVHTVRLTHSGQVGALDALDDARMAERWYYSSRGPFL